MLITGEKINFLKAGGVNKVCLGGSGYFRNVRRVLLQRCRCYGGRS